MTASADWADFDWEFARDLFGRAQHQAAQAQRYAAITGPDPAMTVLSARPNAAVWPVPLRRWREQSRSG